MCGHPLSAVFFSRRGRKCRGASVVFGGHVSFLRGANVGAQVSGRKCGGASVVLPLTLDLQTCRFEKLDTVNTFIKHGAIKFHEFLVPIKRRIDDISQCYDNAFAIFTDVNDSWRGPRLQLFGVFTVRDGRYVASGEPCVLEHCMSEPMSLDDGQTLLGFVENENGLRYDSLLDLDSGKQRLLQADSSGRPLKSDLYTSIWVRSSE